MKWNEKELVRNTFEELGVETTDTFRWLECYYGCRLLVGKRKAEEPYLYHLRNPVFARYFDVYGFRFIDIPESNPKNVIDQIETLCSMLEWFGLCDVKKFLNTFLPFALHDSYAYFDMFAGFEQKAWEIIALLVLLKFHQMLSDEARTSLAINDVHARFCGLYDVNVGHLSALDLWNECTFAKLWNAVFFSKMDKISVKINGKITDAVRRYRDKRMPLKHLLQDYHDVKLHRRELEQAIDPWMYLNRNIKKIPVEGGLTVEETLFEKAAFLLKNERPTDVIRGIFYPPSRNDSGIECGFVYEKFACQIEEANHVLIVNPSPDLVRKWSEDARFHPVKACFAVADLTVSELYKSEFPTADFLPFENISELNGLDSALIFGRDLSENDLKKALSALHIIRDGAVVLALLPNAVIDRAAFKFRYILAESRCNVERILILPPDASASNPRKKALLYIQKDEEQTESFMPLDLYTGVCDETKNLHIRPMCRVVSRDTFDERNLTLKGLLKPAKGVETTEIKSRGAPRRYYFSKEIVLRYTDMLPIE